MSTPREKIRRWFQIHLSTAIVLMFVAGGLMWLNNVPEMLKPIAMEISPNGIYGATHEALPRVGWPLRIHDKPLVTSEMDETSYNYIVSYESYWYLANLTVAVLILISIALLLEWRIRRKHPLPTPEPQ